MDQLVPVIVSIFPGYLYRTVNQSKESLFTLSLYFLVLNWKMYLQKASMISMGSRSWIFNNAVSMIFGAVVYVLLRPVIGLLPTHLKLQVQIWTAKLQIQNSTTNKARPKFVKNWLYFYSFY